MVRVTTEYTVTCAVYKSRGHYPHRFYVSGTPQTCSKYNHPWWNCQWSKDLLAIPEYNFQAGDPSLYIIQFQFYIHQNVFLIQYIKTPLCVLDNCHVSSIFNLPGIKKRLSVCIYGTLQKPFSFFFSMKCYDFKCLSL